MKQVNYFKYGSAEELKITDVAEPIIKGKNQVIVKVLYSSLNAIDWKNRKGHFRIFSGLLKPRTKQGFDVVGIVTAKSEDVKEFALGDKIVGQASNFTGGAFSEYILLHTKQIIKAPQNIDDKQLAGLPLAAATAWQGLFESAKLKAGDNILINGGSSGVGHFAIQIAKAYGANITTVSSEKNLEFCKNLGADITINYEQDDFTKLDQKFNIIFDIVPNADLKKVQHILKPDGIYIKTVPALELFTAKQAKFILLRPNKETLSGLLRLMENGRLKTHIDKIFDLEDIVKAHQYMEQFKTVGKVIIKVAH